MSLFDRKYKFHRPKFRDGQILLTSSSKPLASAIRKIDRVKPGEDVFAHHCEVIFTKNGRVLSVGAHPEGVTAEFVSIRAKQKKWSDFKLLDPVGFTEEQIQKGLTNSMKQAEGFVRYDFSEVLKVLIYQQTGVHLNKLGNQSKNICSEFCQLATIFTGAESYLPERIERPFFTPQDFLRYLNEEEYKIIAE